MAHKCPDCGLSCDCTEGDVVAYTCVHCDDGRADLDEEDGESDPEEDEDDEDFDDDEEDDEDDRP